MADHSKKHHRDDDRFADSNVSVLATARQRATDAARVAGEEIDGNPLAIVAGGLALGVLIGTALPRSARETALLRPAGRRLVETARSAIGAARETGRQELAAAGLSRDNAKGQANRAVEGLFQALNAAVQAGGKAAQRTATRSH